MRPALHSLAAGGQMWRLDELAPLPADFSLALAERWQEAEDATELWRALGLTATREDVRDTHLSVVANATGRSQLEVYDDWLDAPET